MKQRNRYFASKIFWAFWREGEITGVRVSYERRIGFDQKTKNELRIGTRRKEYVLALTIRHVSGKRHLFIKELHGLGVFASGSENRLLQDFVSPVFDMACANRLGLTQRCDVQGSVSGVWTDASAVNLLRFGSITIFQKLYFFMRQIDFFFL